jgi:DNA-binding CsgD family transcriptional regulator
MSDDTVILGGVEVELTSSTGQQFVTDCVRSAEGLTSDRELVELYAITPADWGNITKNTALIRAIQIERAARVRSGAAAKEMASKHFVRAPGVLDQIMNNEQMNARHRVEAIREMRAIAAPEKQNSQPDNGRFIIQINIGDESHTYNKSIASNPNDTPPDERPELPKRPKLTLSASKEFESDE